MVRSSRQVSASLHQETNERLRECDAEALALLERYQEEVGVSPTLPLLQRMTLGSDVLSLVGFYPFGVETPTRRNQRRAPRPTLDAGKHALAGDLDTFLQTVAKKMMNPKGVPLLPHSKPITEASRGSNISKFLLQSHKRRAYAMKLDGERVFFLYLHSEMFEVTIRHNKNTDEDEIEYHRITDDPLLAKALKRCGFVGLFLDSERMYLEKGDNDNVKPLGGEEVWSPKRQKRELSSGAGETDAWRSKPILEQSEGEESHKPTRQNSHISLQAFDVYWAAFSNPSMGARGSLASNRAHPSYLYGDDISDRLRWMNSYIPLVNSLFDPTVTLLVRTNLADHTIKFYTWDGVPPTATEASMGLPNSFVWPRKKILLEGVYLGTESPQMVSPNVTFPRPTDEPRTTTKSEAPVLSLLAQGDTNSPLELFGFSVGGRFPTPKQRKPTEWAWEVRRCALRCSDGENKFTAHLFPEPVRYPRFTPLSLVGSKWAEFPSQRVSDASDVQAAKKEAQKLTNARGAQNTMNRRSLWPKAAWLDQTSLFSNFEVASAETLISALEDGSMTTVQARMNFALDGKVEEASVACDGELTRTLGQAGLTSTQSLHTQNNSVPVPDIKGKFSATIDITTSLKPLQYGNITTSLKPLQYGKHYRTWISRKKKCDVYTDVFDEDNKIGTRDEKLASLYVEGDESGNLARVGKLEELFEVGLRTNQLTSDQESVVVEYAMRFKKKVYGTSLACYLVPIGLRPKKMYSNALLTYINTWDLCRSYYDDYDNWRGPQLVADFAKGKTEKTRANPATEKVRVPKPQRMDLG